MLVQVAFADVLYEMTFEEKHCVWNCRDHLIQLPHMFRRVVQSCFWENPLHVDAVHDLMRKWCSLTIFDAMMLLDSTVHDSAVKTLKTKTKQKKKICNTFFQQLW